MTDKKEKLIEGKWYDFTVEKLLWLPGDENEHFVLSGPLQTRYLLPVEPYKDYKINTGKKIRCRVDKINCNGKVFIEPEHPQYKEGRSYAFEFVRKEKRVNQIGEAEEIIVVRDMYGNEINAPGKNVEMEVVNNHVLTCKVEVIKKGKVHLSVIHRGRFAEHLEVNKSYPFKVLKLAKGVDNMDYYVLEDPAGSMHLIRQDYYKDFRIKVGEMINGTVVKYSSEGRYIVEPDHPLYKTGESYPFEAVTEVREKNAQNGYSSYLIVKDKKEKTYKVKLSKPENLPELPATVHCTIEKLRKGRLVITLDESTFD